MAHGPRRFIAIRPGVHGFELCGERGMLGRTLRDKNIAQGISLLCIAYVIYSEWQVRAYKHKLSRPTVSLDFPQSTVPQSAERPGYFRVRRVSGNRPIKRPRTIPTTG